MEILRSVARSILKSSHSPIEADVPIPRPSFPKFPALPIELRLKIWRLAVEPRIIPVHVHSFHGDGDDANAPPTVLDDNDTVNDPTSMTDQMQNGRRLMCITTCSLKHGCGCWSHPPSTKNIVAPPALFSTCRESRNACIVCYSRELGGFYNYRGCEVTLGSSSSFLEPSSYGYKAWDPSNTGITMYPAVDIPLLKFNVASHSSISPLKQFVRIAAREWNDISRVVISCSIAMPPYKFWQGSRFTYWQNWGSGSDWVPRDVVKFPNLREVIVIAGNSEFLPNDWKERTISIWTAVLSGMSHHWPAEWGGNMPELRFVTRVEDLPGRVSPSSLSEPYVPKPFLTRVGELPLRGLEAGVEGILRYLNRNN